MSSSFSVAAEAPVRPRSFDLRFYGLFALCLLLIFPMHESAHYLTYRALGIHVPLTLNTASPIDQSQRKPIAEFAGPLFNLLLAIGCAFAYSMLTNGRLLWIALGSAASMMRLAIYVIIVITAAVAGSGMAAGNDEPIAAHLWGLPDLTFVGALAPLFAFIMWYFLRSLAGSIRSKLLNVLCLTLVTLGIGVFVGNVLDPWLFPHR